MSIFGKRTTRPDSSARYWVSAARAADERRKSRRSMGATRNGSGKGFGRIRDHPRGGGVGGGFGRHRVATAPAPGMTAAETPKGQPTAPRRPVPANRLQGVIGTGRRETAARRQNASRAFRPGRPRRRGSRSDGARRRDATRQTPLPLRGPQIGKGQGRSPRVAET